MKLIAKSVPILAAASGAGLLAFSQASQYTRSIGDEIGFATAGMLSTLFGVFGAVEPHILRIKEESHLLIQWRFWLDGDQEDKLKRCISTSLFQHFLSDVQSISSFQAVTSGFVDFAFKYGGKDVFRGSSPVVDTVGLAIDEYVAVAIGTLVVTCWLFRRLLFWLSPGAVLLMHCIPHANLKRANLRQVNSTQSVTRLSRWRNQNHERMFHIANLTERCLPVLRKRLSHSDFRAVAITYTALANTIRREAIRQNLPPAKLSIFSWMTAALVANDDPVATARRVARIMPTDTTNPDSISYSPLSTFLANVNEFLEKNTRLFASLGLLVIVTYYVTTKQLESLFDFVKSLVGK